MSGGWKRAKPAGRRPLDGRVRRVHRGGRQAPRCVCAGCPSCGGQRTASPARKKVRSRVFAGCAVFEAEPEHEYQTTEGRFVHEALVRLAGPTEYRSAFPPTVGWRRSLRTHRAESGIPGHTASERTGRLGCVPIPASPEFRFACRPTAGSKSRSSRQHHSKSLVEARGTFPTGLAPAMLCQPCSRPSHSGLLRTGA